MGNLKITPPGFKKELLLKLMQEHHLAVYHTICSVIEEVFYA